VLSAAFPLRPTLLVFDVLRPSMSLTICQAENSKAATQCGLVLLIVTVAILGAWMRLVWKNRNVQHPLFSETKRIAVAVVILVFMLGLVMAVEFGMSNGDRNAVQVKVVIRGVGVLVSILVSMLILYGSRLLEVVQSNRHLANTSTANATVLGDEEAKSHAHTPTAFGAAAATQTKPRHVQQQPSRISIPAPIIVGQARYAVSLPGSVAPSPPSQT
jgi:hypothetical protein